MVYYKISFMAKVSKTKTLLKYSLLAFILINFYGCAGKYFLSREELDNVSKQIEDIKIDIENIQDEIVKINKNQEDLSETFNLLIKESSTYFTTFNEEVYHFYSQIEDRFIALQRDIINLQKKFENKENTTLQLAPTAQTTDKIVVGEVEKVRVTPPNLIFTARIDSGAETSSIDARNVQPFERDGKEWVRFQIPDPSDEELLHTVERPVVRWVKVLQSSAEGKDRRAVVELQFEIGHIKRIEEFNLTDRSQMSYSVLIGRNILRDLMVVDVSKKFATSLPKDNGSDNR